MDSHVRPQAHGPNRQTELHAERELGSPKPVDLHGAYAFARGAIGLSPSGQRGHRLVWVRHTAFAAQNLSAADGVFAVVGRHTQCSMVLPADPTVALRHLLVRSIELPSGGVALRVFDLHTDLGFTLPNGTRQTSVFAEGPVAIGVGEYALVALPDGDLPEVMPAPVMATPPAVRDQLAVINEAMSPYRVNARPNRASRITLMPSLMMVGTAGGAPSLGRLAGGAFTLTLTRGGRSATVRLTEQDLACGVIIGRSEKCHSEELRRVTEVGTSRVHLMLLREGPFVSAYDLGSTQGTYAPNGARIHRAVLPETGGMLALGGTQDAVRLVWQRA